MRASNGCSNLLGATVTAAAATYDVGTMLNFALTMTTRLGTPEEKRTADHIGQCHKKDCSAEFCRKRDTDSIASGLLSCPNKDGCCLKEGSSDDQDTSQKPNCKSNRKKPSWRSLTLKNKRWFKEQVINILLSISTLTCIKSGILMISLIM